METKAYPQRTLKNHLAISFRYRFESFDWRKLRKDVLWGAIVCPLVALYVAVHFGLSTRDDWDEHPVVLVVVAVLPISILLIDVIWRIWQALRTVYRQRSEGFRETIHAGGAIILGAYMCAAVISHGNYKTSPHFRLSIDTGEYLRASGYAIGSYIIGSSREEPHPNTEVTFLFVGLTNSGVRSPAKNWKLRVKIRDQYLDGVPRTATNEFADPKDSSKSTFRYTPLDMIFVKANTPFTDRLEGIADFIIVGASDDVVRQPGNKLILSCEDDHGAVATREEKVSAKEIAFMRH